MTAFLTLEGFRKAGFDYNPTTDREFALNIDHIDEIVAGVRYRTSSGNVHAQAVIVLSAHFSDENPHSYTVVAGPEVTRTYDHEDLPASSAAKKTKMLELGEKARTLTVSKLASQLTAIASGMKQTIECKCCDDEEEEDDNLPAINWRGVWKASVLYKPLDGVIHPDDAKKGYVALQQSQQPSKTTLDHKSTWLPVTIPAASE